MKLNMIEDNVPRSLVGDPYNYAVSSFRQMTAAQLTNNSKSYQYLPNGILIIYLFCCCCIYLEKLYRSHRENNYILFDDGRPRFA